MATSLGKLYWKYDSGREAISFTVTLAPGTFYILLPLAPYKAKKENRKTNNVTDVFPVCTLNPKKYDYLRIIGY